MAIDGGASIRDPLRKVEILETDDAAYSRRTSPKKFKPKTYTQTIRAEKGKSVEITHRLNSETLVVTAADSLGKRVPVSFKPTGNTKISVTPKADCEALTLTITTKDPNKRTPAQVTGDMFAYVGTMIRRVQVTYRETDNTWQTRTKQKGVQVGKTVGRATGGTEKLMPIHEALAKQTMNVVREGSKNRFGQKLMEDAVRNREITKDRVRKVEEYTSEFSVDDFDSESDFLEDNRKTNTFVVRENGKRWQMEVAPELY